MGTKLTNAQINYIKDKVYNAKTAQLNKARKKYTVVMTDEEMFNKIFKGEVKLKGTVPTITGSCNPWREQTYENGSYYLTDLFDFDKYLAKVKKAEEKKAKVAAEINAEAEKIIDTMMLQGVEQVAKLLEEFNAKEF